MKLNKELLMSLIEGEITAATQRTKEAEASAKLTQRILPLIKKLKSTDPRKMKQYSDRLSRANTLKDDNKRKTEKEQILKDLSGD